MTICPLCEHVQAAGDVCEVCGRALAPAGGAEAAVAPIEGLDPTLHAFAAAASDALPDLERTCLDDVAVEPGAPPEWLEHTELSTDVDAQPTEPGLTVEPTLHAPAPPDPARDPFALELCRYCRAELAPGEVFCGRCGMKMAHRPAPGDPRQDG